MRDKLGTVEGTAKVTGKDLARAMRQIAPGLVSVPTRDRQACLEWNSKSIRLYSTAGHVTASRQIGALAQPSSEGRVSVEWKALSRLAVALPGELDLKITSWRGELGVLRASDGGNWVELDALPGEPPIAIEPMAVEACYVVHDGTPVRTARKYASTDTGRPILRTVYLQGDKVVSTDSYRLAALGVLADSDLPPLLLHHDAAALVPAGKWEFVLADAVDVLGKVAVPGKVWVLGWYGEDGVHVSCSTVEGAYPNWQPLVPLDKAPTRVSVPRKEVAALLGRMGAVAGWGGDKGAPVVQLRLGTESAVEVKATYPRMCIAQPLPVAVEGADVEINFNPVFLKEGLGALQGKQVTMDVRSPLEPVVLRDEASDVYLLMPVRTA